MRSEHGRRIDKKQEGHAVDNFREMGPISRKGPGQNRESEDIYLFSRVWTTTAALSAILLALVVVLCALPLFRELQARINDTCFRLVPRKPSPVVLVLIDDESLRQYGRWPWSRGLLAQMVDRIAAAGASVIGLDILFSEPQSAEADGMLRNAFKAVPHMVVVDKIAGYPDGPRWLEPIDELLSPNVSVGHALAPLDSDGVCRRFPPLELSPTGVRWAFAVELARQVDPQRAIAFLSAYHIGETTDAGAFTLASPVLVPIAFQRGDFKTISAAAVLQSRALHTIRGRPVLIGFGPVELGDRLMTPLGGDIPATGIEIHAQVLDSILTGRRVHESPLPLTFGLLILACPLFVTAFRHTRRWQAVGLMLAIGVGIYGLTCAVFVWCDFLLPSAPFLAAVLLAPLVIFSADFFLIERSLTTQLLEMQLWLSAPNVENRTALLTAGRRAPTTNDISWKLRTLEGLQAELGALNEFHKTLLESTADALAIFDGHGNLILENRRFAALPPWPGEEFRNLASTLAQWMPNAAENAGIEQEIEFAGKLYGVRSIPLPATNFSPLGGILLSITSLVTRQERDRARAEALGFLTHELRTPLASIQQYAELMIAYPKSPLSARAPQTIFGESIRLLALIGSYLDVLRLDAGALPIRAERVNLETVTREVFAVLRPLAAAREMLLDYTGEGQAVTVGDPPLLTGAILNLVSNAIKYGVAGSPVEVRGADVEGGVLLSVTNKAEDIGELDLKRWFDAYYRSPSAEGSAPGWGIGLTFVKRIADKHGGSVSASVTGNCITIAMRLPAYVSKKAVVGEEAREDST